MDFNDKLHIDPIRMEKIQQLGEGAAADAIATIIKECDQAVKESIPCHYCGAHEWSIDPTTRRTICCQSL